MSEKNKRFGLILSAVVLICFSMCAVKCNADSVSAYKACITAGGSVVETHCVMSGMKF